MPSEDGTCLDSQPSRRPMGLETNNRQGSTVLEATGRSEIGQQEWLESHGGTSNPDDRQIGRYDDSDWSRENPNRAFGKEVSRTGTTCAEYCPYIKVTSLNDWAVSNRPAVEPIVFRSPHRLVRDARNEDITWIRLTYFWFHNC